MKPKPNAGQMLWRLNIGNNARHKAQVLTPVRVTKVGRKYFSAITTDTTYGLEVEYRLDNWHEHSDFSANWCLYSDEQEWMDEKEAKTIKKELQEAFAWSGDGHLLPLHALRLIREILNEPSQ